MNLHRHLSTLGALLLALAPLAAGAAVAPDRLIEFDVALVEVEDVPVVVVPHPVRPATSPTAPAASTIIDNIFFIVVFPVSKKFRRSIRFTVPVRKSPTPPLRCPWHSPT